jgi:hypothetical protein
MLNKVPTSATTKLLAALGLAMLASATAQAMPLNANKGGPSSAVPGDGGGPGNKCDPGQGQSFVNCTWSGSPTIIKFNVGGTWDVNPGEAGPGWDIDPSDGPVLADIDGDANTVTYSLNGFTVVFSNSAADPKSVSWTYDNSGSLVTYWHIKYGGQDQWVVLGNGTAVSSGTWNNDTGIKQAISHITFFDSGEKNVPEPGTLAMLAVGLLGLGAARRRKAA